MTRPPMVVVVAGTSTGVGKTWVTARVAAALRAQGVAVSARKPVQSFAPEERGSTDAEVLGAATGEPAEVVCPPHRWYERPMAPPMAADALDLPPFGVGDLSSEISAGWNGRADIGFVELAGGPRSPIATDGDGIDLTFSLHPEAVVLVADAGLGTINAVRLCVDTFRPIDDDAIVVVLNRYDPTDDLHVRNADWLSDRLGYDVVTDLDELTSRLAPS
jgi:dethiobiotin synthetase